MLTEFIKLIKKNQLLMMDLIEEVEDFSQIKRLRHQIIEIQNFLEDIEECR
jgi:hypothetical protein